MTKLTPRTANTLHELGELKEHYIKHGKFWLSVSEDSVTVSYYVNAELTEVQVTMPKKAFNKLVDFYNGEQK